VQSSDLGVPMSLAPSQGVAPADPLPAAQGGAGVSTAPSQPAGPMASSASGTGTCCSVVAENAVVFQQENPKQQGSAAQGRYETYKKCRSFAAASAAGATARDLRFDVEKGYAKDLGIALDVLEAAWACGHQQPRKRQRCGAPVLPHPPLELDDPQVQCYADPRGQLSGSARLSAIPFFCARLVAVAAARPAWPMSVCTCESKPPDRTVLGTHPANAAF
jgi:hypothetical protein